MNKTNVHVVTISDWCAEKKGLFEMKGGELCGCHSAVRWNTPASYNMGQFKVAFKKPEAVAVSNLPLPLSFRKMVLEGLKEIAGRGDLERAMELGEWVTWKKLTCLPMVTTGEKVELAGFRFSPGRSASPYQDLPEQLPAGFPVDNTHQNLSCPDLEEWQVQVFEPWEHLNRCCIALTKVLAALETYALSAATAVIAWPQCEQFIVKPSSWAKDKANRRRKLTCRGNVEALRTQVFNPEVPELVEQKELAEKACSLLRLIKE